MVHFPGLALASLCIQLAVTSMNWPGSPIRKSRGHGLFAPRPSLSQLTTSLIAFTRLGIHRVPLVALPLNLLIANLISTSFLLRLVPLEYQNRLWTIQSIQ